jgi:cell wall-associated NlpC family hydrolase
MPKDDVSVDHAEFEDLLDRARELEEDGGDYSTEGLDGQVDPAVLEALRDEESEDEEKSAETNDHLDTADRMSKDTRDAADDAADRIRSIDAEEPGRGAHTSAEAAAAEDAVSKLTQAQSPPQTYSPPSAAAGPLIPGASMVGGASPTGGYDAQAELARMQQPGLVNYGASPAPTPATSTQYDAYNAPNREELIQAIMEYADAEYTDEEYADNDTYTAGGGTVNPLGDGATADEAAVKKLAQEYVDLHQDYAWGGGHAAEPGPSQGTTDGGYADQCGDYNKVGMDCSGLARDFIYNLSGVDIGAGGTDSQIASGEPVEEGDLKPGDLVFPNSGHVQVYIGDGQVVEAAESGTQYKISEYQPGPQYIRRFVNVDTGH